VAEVITEPLRAIGVEFVVDDLVAIRLLHAAYTQTELTALLWAAQADTRPMEELIRVLTRPIQTAADHPPTP
jgi:hypothetical protein